MGEKYVSSVSSVAVGTNKTLMNLFNAAVTPTSRARIYDLLAGSVATPADQAGDFYLGRTTALGTEGSGLVPNNLDPTGPAGECDSGLGVFGIEPTYAAVKQLLQFQLNQRGTFRWVAVPGAELMLAATQNNGAGLKSLSATSTQGTGCTIFFEE